MAWISVKQQMPRNHRKVIIWDTKEGVDFRAWHDKTFGWLFHDGIQAKNVTHWQPMPTKPRS